VRTIPAFHSVVHQDLRLDFSNNAFVYLPAPPRVLVVTALELASGTVKEWDTRSPESEKFSTADLEPFRSMVFCSQFSWNPAVPKESRSRRSPGSSSPRRPPTKRKKVEEDIGPLDELIPLVLDPSRAVL